MKSVWSFENPNDFQESKVFPFMSFPPPPPPVIPNFVLPSAPLAEIQSPSLSNKSEEVKQAKPTHIKIQEEKSSESSSISSIS